MTITHMLTKEKITVDILNILTIPIGVGEKGRGATCHWSQMAFDNGFFLQTQKTLLRFTFSNIC